MRLQKIGSSLYLIGKPKDECGGSAYYEILEELSRSPRDSLLGAAIPSPDFGEVGVWMRTVIRLISEGTVRAAHDISDGGMLLALFEMTVPQRKLGGSIGVEIDLAELKSPLPSDKLLFSQSPGFILEVDPAQREAFLRICGASNVQPLLIGHTTEDAYLFVQRGGSPLLRESLAELRNLWEHGLERSWES